MRLRESGIIDHITKKYKKNVDKCKIKNMEKESSAGYPLGLYAMVSAFIVLGIGVGLSLFAFALELVIHRASKSQSEHIAPKSLSSNTSIPVIPTVSVSYI